ncbi:MAG: alanine racemase [Patescibacteria group bacterium]
MKPNLKVWVNISSKDASHNYKTVRSLLAPKTKLWAVVKSNAYGHGLLAFSKIANDLGVDGFCVDSVVEGTKLRQNGIKKPILVLGPTLPGLLVDAAKNKIAVTISAPEQLTAYLKSKFKPEFHLKIDTGMHRQGFYPNDLKKIIRQIKNFPPQILKTAHRRRDPVSGGTRLKIQDSLTGVYTHFASAKDINYPTFTDLQFEEFQKAVRILEKSGFKNLIKHCAASGGALINKKYHLDAARIGIALYGLWPSRELEVQLGNKIKLKPVLSWHSIISETKSLKKGDYVGYDLTEKILKPTKIAVIPIGYWHGFDRKLSSVGEVLIKNKRARVLGRVSMDLIVVDVGNIQCRAGDRATLIGGEITASELAQKTATTHYEIITRINPLTERIVI